MAIRGSPAKGVDWVYRCQGSNPCFSAINPQIWGFLLYYTAFSAYRSLIGLLIVGFKADANGGSLRTSILLMVTCLIASTVIIVLFTRKKRTAGID